MAWSQLSINRPHLVYIILGGFTSIFMLCSLFIKEKLYIGEATVATVCGVIFGPHAANLINPLDWGNTDQITLEFSRIVLVVQCFAVGVELPKAYMERHWKSVVLLLVPVMTFGWLITSLFVWWMVEPLSWLEALCVAACVTATDPVLASSVVGKGKFAKRVPKHLRDILSAESGCNDGMAFPFIYLALYLIHYHLGAKEVVFHWFCFSILYECVFGAVFGVLVGYIGRHAIRLAERKGIIDRESFLVFYFVLALFCAGSGSLLGMDDLLIGFAAGVGFSNDGWFTERTEESHVSNVIDLLINLAYFVYFGTIIPWDQYNAPDHGLVPWKLVILAILVILFRRIPAMLLLKPIIPDVKTWREALFAGHFGPIGVGAIFVAILARAELETSSTTPLAVLPGPEDAEFTLIYTVWPIVTFLVIASIVVHGSSIAVFTLGKRINTLTITLTYTQDNEKSSAWMNRLPRISSQSRSMSRMSDDEISLDKEFPPGTLPPIGIPKLALRRQREEDNDKPGSRPSSLRPLRRRKKKEYGGPISQSAITPARRSEPNLTTQESSSDIFNEKSDQTSPFEAQEDTRQHDRLRSGDSSPEREERKSRRKEGFESPPSTDSPAEVEAFEEGHEIVIEDEEGNVLETVDVEGKTEEEKRDIIEAARKKLSKDHSGLYTKHKHQSHKKNEGEDIERGVEEATGHPEKKLKKVFDQWKGFGKRRGTTEGGDDPRETRKRGPAHAYQFGNTIIVEDEDGEVIKKYTIPGQEGQQRRFTYTDKQVRQGLQRMGTWVGLSSKAQQAAADTAGVSVDDLKETDDSPRDRSPDGRNDAKTPMKTSTKTPVTEKKGDDYFTDDDGLRMTISRTERYGLTGRQKPKPGNDGEDDVVALSSGRRLSTRDFIQQLQALDPKAKVKQAEASNASEDLIREVKRDAHEQSQNDPSIRPSAKRFETTPMRQTRNTIEEDQEGEEEEELTSKPTSRGRARSDLDPAARGRPGVTRSDTADSTRDVPVHDARSTIARHGRGLTAAEERRQRLSTQFERSGGREITERDEDNDLGGEQETAAERRRRLAALGVGADESDSSESEEDNMPRRPREHAVYEPGESPPPVERKRIQWGGERGREAEKAREEGEGGSSHGGKAKKLRGFLKK